MNDENKLRKFKLIDRDGFINKSINYNTEIVEGYCEDGIVEGYSKYNGSLDVGYPRGNVEEDELSEFFKEVFDEVQVINAIALDRVCSGKAPHEGDSQTFRETGNPVEETTPIYWDGNNTDDIEVGMVVATDAVESEVHLVDKVMKQVILKGSGTYLVRGFGTLKSALPTEKEQAFTKFMRAWKRQGLDFADDMEMSKTTLGQAFNVFYKTFLEEK